MSSTDKNKDGSGKSGDEGNFGTPDNYFDSFSSRLFSKIKANDELKDYPLLSGLEKYNPFVVPAGYFEAKEELLAYPVLRDLKQRNFMVPSDYFETLPARAATKIEVEAELKEYTVLASVEKGYTFAVPADYFENFYSSVKTVVAPARVIPLFGRALKSYKFAAAAVVALLLTLTIILLNQKTEIQPLNAECNTLACLSKSDILNSGVLQNLSEENLIEMIGEETVSDSVLIGKGKIKEMISTEDVLNEIDVNTLTEEL